MFFKISSIKIEIVIQFFCNSSESNAVLRKAMKRAGFILVIHVKDLTRLQ